MKHKLILLVAVVLAACEPYEAPLGPYRLTRIDVTGEALGADGTRVSGPVAATLHAAGCVGGPLASSPQSPNPIRYTFEFPEGLYNLPLCVRISADVNPAVTFDNHSVARDHVQANDSVKLTLRYDYALVGVGVSVVDTTLIRPNDVSVEIVEPGSARTFVAQQLRDEYGRLYTGRIRSDTAGTITVNVNVNSTGGRSVGTVSYAAKPDVRVDVSAIVSARNPSEWCGSLCGSFVAFPIHDQPPGRNDSLFVATTTWTISQWREP